MSLQLDLVEQATIRQDASGIEAVRRGLLREVGGAAKERQRSALNAPGLPRYGDVYEPIPELRVVDIQLTPFDVASWNVTVIYRVPTPTERAHILPLGSVVDVQWFSANATVDRLYDANGQRMFHWYAGNPTSLTIQSGNVVEVRSNTRQIGVKAERGEVPVPSAGARVTLTEASDPRTRLGFIGKVNAGYWSGNPPKTWFFANLSGARERDRWINTYELLYRADTWRLRSDIEFNGAPPSDASEGNGIQFFNVFESANFNALGFSL